LTAAALDKRVAAKLGPFFAEVLAPTMTKLIEAGLSCDDVKRAVRISSGWGTKVRCGQFRERAEAALKAGRAR
jgi:hypothetical protein